MDKSQVLKLVKHFFTPVRVAVFSAKNDGDYCFSSEQPLYIFYFAIASNTYHPFILYFFFKVRCFGVAKQKPVGKVCAMKRLPLYRRFIDTIAYDK